MQRDIRTEGTEEQRVSRKIGHRGTGEKGNKEIEKQTVQRNRGSEGIRELRVNRNS